MHEVQPILNGTDLVDAVCLVLKANAEPMTPMMIRQRVPADLRGIRLEELSEVLQRQVAAHVLVMCPKYRSAQDRYWDRSLREHAKVLMIDALQAGPLSWTDLRKKLPKYLRHLADSVLNEELARGAIFRHPPASVRMGPRYALQPADMRSYLSRELHELLLRFESNGFARTETREAMMQLLQQEEFAEVLP